MHDNHDIDSKTTIDQIAPKEEQTMHNNTANDSTITFDLACTVAGLTGAGETALITYNPAYATRVETRMGEVPASALDDAVRSAMLGAYDEAAAACGLEGQLRSVSFDSRGEVRSVRFREAPEDEAKTLAQGKAADALIQAGSDAMGARLREALDFLPATITLFV